MRTGPVALRTALGEHESLRGNRNPKRLQQGWQIATTGIVLERGRSGSESLLKMRDGVGEFISGIVTDDPFLRLAQNRFGRRRCRGEEQQGASESQWAREPSFSATASWTAPVLWRF